MQNRTGQAKVRQKEGGRVIWILLTPREVSIVEEPRTLTDGPNAQVLASVRLKLNQLTGDLELTDDDLDRVKRAERNWKFGYQRQFQAVLQAAERHP
jgi:hypothetical protein